MTQLKEELEAKQNEAWTGKAAAATVRAYLEHADLDASVYELADGEKDERRVGRMRTKVSPEVSSSS